MPRSVLSILICVPVDLLYPHDSFVKYSGPHFPDAESRAPGQDTWLLWHSWGAWLQAQAPPTHFPAPKKPRGRGIGCQRLIPALFLPGLVRSALGYPVSVCSCVPFRSSLLVCSPVPRPVQCFSPAATPPPPRLLPQEW